MFEIAGGILLAVAILYFLPLIVSFTVTVVSAVILIGVIGIAAFLILKEFEAALIIVSVLLGTVFTFTIGAAIIGIVVSRFPVLKNRYKNRIPLVKPIDKDMGQFVDEVYKYYQPIGITVFTIGIVSFIISVIVAAVAIEIIK